jgi:hypothetical protein
MLQLGLNVIHVMVQAKYHVIHVMEQVYMLVLIVMALATIDQQEKIVSYATV